MHIAQLLLPAARQRRRRPARILDLPAIDIALRELLKQIIRHLLVRDPCLAEERAPDLSLRGRREFVEVQRNVDAREERLVEGLDAVRGEEEDAAVVLDVAQAATGTGVGEDTAWVSGPALGEG